MMSPQQNAILEKRSAILEKLGTGLGSLNERMQSVIKDVAQLGAMMNQWIDDQAIKYREAGMELEEWFDDIVDWLKNNQFMVEEIQNITECKGHTKCVLHCHLFNEGLGRHVVMKFTLLR